MALEMKEKATREIKKVPTANVAVKGLL